MVSVQPRSFALSRHKDSALAVNAWFFLDYMKLAGQGAGRHSRKVRCGCYTTARSHRGQVPSSMCFLTHAFRVDRGTLRSLAAFLIEPASAMTCSSSAAVMVAHVSR